MTQGIEFELVKEKLLPHGKHHKQHKYSLSEIIDIVCCESSIQININTLKQALAHYNFVEMQKPKAINAIFYYKED